MQHYDLPMQFSASLLDYNGTKASFGLWSPLGCPLCIE